MTNAGTDSKRLMSGAQVVLECLVRENVDCIFGYPGGVTLPLYDAMYDHRSVTSWCATSRTPVSPRKATLGRQARSESAARRRGPGATNLVTGLVDAMMDSIPVVAITGQVSTKLIGSDAFQEADTFGITRSCTKHNFLVKSLADLPQAIHEAFHIAATGRPGPVLVDIPKDVFQAKGALFTGLDHSFAGLQGLHRGPCRTDSPRRADDLGGEASVRVRRRRYRRRRRIGGTAGAGRVGRRCQRSAR